MSIPSKTLSFFLVYLIIVCLLITLFGCGKQTDDEQITYLVGVSQANLIDPWQIAIKEDIERQAEQYPDVKVIYADAGSSNEKQQSDIADMLVQQVDVIIIFPNEIDYIAGTIQEVYSGGTDIILLGYPIQGGFYSTRIYTENFKIGKIAGEYAVNLLDGNGIVLEFQGDPDNLMSVQRKIGFLDAIDAYPNVVKEYVAVGYWSRDNAEEVLDSSGLLYREPQIELVFAHNDEIAIGASKLIKSKGMDIYVIGIDGLSGNNRGIEAVKAGMIDATIKYPTGGREAMEYAVKLLEGEEIPNEIELQAQLITVDNVDEF